MSSPFPDAAPDSTPAESQPVTPEVTTSRATLMVVPNPAVSAVPVMGIHEPRRRPKREQRATQTILVSAEPAKVEQVKTEDPLSALFGAALRLCIDHPAAVLIGMGAALLVGELESKPAKKRQPRRVRRLRVPTR